MKFVVEDRQHWTLPGLLRVRAQQHGDRLLVSSAEGHGSLTYGSADQLSDRLAAGLNTLGIGPHDCVLLMMRNRVEFALSWFALSKLGSYHAPINVDYRGDFLEHVVNISHARTLILESEFLPALVACASGLPFLQNVVVLDPAPGADPGPFRMVSFSSLLLDEQPPAVVSRPADPYAVLFTSGSTGRSKGALITQAHGHLIAERNRALLDLTSDGVYLTELPVFHVNAHMAIHGALLIGARAHLEPHFSATRWLQRIRDVGATHTSMLGVMVDFVSSQPPTALDHEHSLRATWMVPCVPDLVRRFRSRFGVERIVTSYGTTEIGMIASRVVADDAPVSAGPIASELYEVQLIDTMGEPVTEGEPGEIVVRPRLPGTIMREYLGNPEETLTAFRDLWFHTGDIGRITTTGDLEFVDRLQDRIRRRGENVASADLEHVLGLHDRVAEVAVVAVVADEQGGEDEIKACIVLDDGNPFDVNAFWAWCDDRLPYFAVPRYVQIVETLPKTATQKIVKWELRKSGAEIADRGPTGRLRVGKR